MLHAVTVRRLRVRVKDGGVGCDSIHGYAFQATCAGCDFRGPRRTIRSDALRDGRAHHNHLTATNTPT